MKKLFISVFVTLLLCVSAFASNISVLDLRENDHYFEIANNANSDLDLGTDYTIEAWIFVKDTTHGNERIFRSQGWQAYVQSGTGDGGNATVIFSGTFMPAGTLSMSVPTNEWHHIALQGNGAGWTNNYLDGTAIGNGGATDITGSLNLRIGSYSTSTTDFVGCIDEVRISTGNRYSRWGFTVSENDPPFTDDANTVLLYHFDDNALPPTNSSSISFTTTNVGITTNDYIPYNDASLGGSDLPLPVTLTAFTAIPCNGTVELAWETASELNNSHFMIFRNGVAIGSVPGAGTSSRGNAYSYIDSDIIPGVSYTYILADVSFSNIMNYYDEKSVTVCLSNDPVEADFVIGTAYPNPFNPSVTIEYHLSDATKVNAAIYNANGDLVETLFNSDKAAGAHEIVWNAANMPSGVYILKMISGDIVNTRKLVLMK